MGKIRLGMVGGGEGAFIGAVHRIASRIDDQFELVAGALSSTPEKALRSAQALGIDEERSYSDFRAMAEVEASRSDGIQAVSIVTPNHMHFPVAKAFLEAGIHVICDKPLTSNLEDALKLEAVARQNNALFILTHNYTAYPLVRQAKQMVTDGKVGKIRVIQVEYPQDWLTADTERTGNKQAEWRTDPSRSGPAGCLGDIGTHAYNLARFISGLRLEQLSADLTTFVDGRVLDDNVHAMLRFEQGAKGMLWSSQVAPGNENGVKIRIYGDKGGLEWAQELPNQLWFTPFGQPQRKLTTSGNGYLATQDYLTRTPGGHPEGYLEAFANIYFEAACCIRMVEQGQNPSEALKQTLLPEISDGVEGMRFVSAVIKSSESDSRWVSLEEV